ncbi:hypothetical protein BVY04_02330 [bacterium M21]|nr:hypothetical protein BVY04_02330 [bacterium M21]
MRGAVPMAVASVASHRVLHINSYHRGYPWSDNLELGMRNGFDKGGGLIDLRHFYMDSKHDQSEEHLAQVTSKVLAEIEAWNPDLVIVSDDNACKYIAAPYLRGKPIPVIFCGVNWDAISYGFPCENVTGMLEIDPVERLKKVLRPFAAGDRIGFLCADVLSTRKVIRSVQQECGVTFADGTFATTFEEWKNAYRRMQGSVDMIFLFSHVGLTGWGDEEAEAWVLAEAKIPSGTMVEHGSPFALVGVVKVAEEQGDWAAKAALKVLNGTPMSEIPVVRNKTARTILNMELARKLEIKFPMELIEHATFVGEDKR